MYLATNVLGKQFALKEVDDKEAAQKEAKALKEAGEHPNVVDVVDIRIIDDTAYIVMPYLEGEQLDKYIEKHRPWTPKAWWHIMLPLLRGVSHIHASELIHRDLKPANIIMVPEQNTRKPVIVDLGLAKRINSDETRLVGGTRKYLPPEWSDLTLIGSQYDLFQLALISYEVLHGDEHYNDAVGKWDLAVVRAELEEVGSSFSKAIANALDDDPGHRPQSCFDWIASMLDLETEIQDLADESYDSYSGQSNSHRIPEQNVSTLLNTGDVTVSSLCREIVRDYGLPDDSLVVLDGSEVVPGQTLLKNHRDAVTPKWAGGWFNKDGEQPHDSQPNLNDLASDVFDRYGVHIGFLNRGAGARQKRLLSKRSNTTFISNFIKQWR